jgi:hypothetical protein
VTIEKGARAAPQAGGVFVFGPTTTPALLLLLAAWATSTRRAERDAIGGRASSVEEFISGRGRGERGRKSGTKVSSFLSIESGDRVLYHFSVCRRLSLLLSLLFSPSSVFLLFQKK